MTRVTNSITGGVQHGITIQGGNLSVELGANGTSITVNGRTVPAGSSDHSQTHLDGLRQQLDIPGPRLAVLTKSESAALYALLAVVAGALPEVEGLAMELAERLSSRVAEYGV